MKGRMRKLFFRGTEPVPGNHVRLLQNGADFFPALIAAIDAAHTEVHLETYIFNVDPSAEAVRDALMRPGAAMRVRLLIDGVGSRELPAAWLDALKTTASACWPIVRWWAAGVPIPITCGGCTASWR
jgi:cardiolipin synthase